MPFDVAVEVPAWLGFEVHAHGEPASCVVRQPCGAVLVCPPVGGIVLVCGVSGAPGLAGMVLVPGVIVEPGVDGVFGVEGVVVGGVEGCVVGAGEVGGGVVCAIASGAAIKHAAAQRTRRRFMVDLLPSAQPAAATYRRGGSFPVHPTIQQPSARACA